MSKFLTPLVAELIAEINHEYRGLWRLTAHLIYQSSTAGQTITVPAGFLTDLESCPRLPVIFLLFGELSHAAAVIHDYLYTCPYIVSRKTADDVLYEAMILSGIPKWRAWGVWVGVRLGGRSHFGEPLKSIKKTV